MPILDETNIGLSENMLIAEELAYDKESLKTKHETLVTLLTNEQQNVYDSVMNDIDSNGGGLFFVYGYRRTGRQDGAFQICYTTLLKRRFHPTCNISQDSDLVELIKRSKLIIWDESLITQKYYFEALDKAMRDLLRFVIPGSAEKTFDGKTIVLGGDFKQILPVIPKATRPVVVGANINSSYLWRNCKVLRLTKNLRLRTLASKEDRQTVDWFSKWIVDIGDGIARVVNNGSSEIDIPAQFLLKCGHNSIAPIVESTFPSSRYDMLDESQLEGRAILSPTLDVVDQINQHMCDMNTAEG
ncbi:PREDICTED: uncharacterized protein LOC109169375 [Ipomoea nil]|uniref:uncharacterized protein LOC109169375 n=1 Tax=Ipomoea nil TaxID=35883 RepID=UPI0009018715|nr:PREDICTED: uncharacterized protein LOC109169375 [Ipomoea nil]